MEVKCLIYLCNGVSNSMLRDPNMKQIPYSLSEREFIELVNGTDFVSVIGHKSLAEALTDITGTDIPYNRTAIQVNYDDIILLVSMNGRLPEHPTKVEYKGRMNYNFIRFEKQTSNDFSNTLNIIHEIKETV